MKTSRFLSLILCLCALCSAAAPVIGPAPVTQPATVPVLSPAPIPAKPNAADALCGFVTISQATATTQPAQSLAAESKFIVSYCRAHGIKRIKAWDASGDDQQEVKYTGDPRLLPKGVARATMVKFFGDIRAAGIGVGGTLRPGWLVRDSVTNTVAYQYSDQYTYSMLTKAQWAAQNYGWSEFYCDSTIDPVGIALDPRPYVLFKMRMPMATFFMENIAVADGTWQSYGRFCDPRIEKPIPNDHYRKLIGCMDSFDVARAQEWRDAAARGDEVMVYATWDAPFNRGVFDALGVP